MLAVIVMYSVVNVIIQSVIQPRVVGQAVGLSTTLTFVSLVFWAWVLGPLGALLAVPMSLFFRAVLVEMDPEASWVTPLVSGRPEERTVVMRTRTPVDSTDPDLRGPAGRLLRVSGRLRRAPRASSS